MEEIDHESSKKYESWPMPWTAHPGESRPPSATSLAASCVAVAVSTQRSASTFVKPSAESIRIARRGPSP